MKRIILHWSAGGYYPCALDRLCYHFLVDKNGKIYKGVFAPENNEICVPNKYAAHTGGGNTGSIGVAMCAMAGFKNVSNIGHYPITKIQFESAMELCAQLCKKYGISTDDVITHYEFGIKHPNTSSKGKIDIIFIPPYPLVKTDEIGNFIRQKIKWYLNKI